jgi:hypothetical protein
MNGKWFDRLSTVAKREYLRSHPRSKMKKRINKIKSRTSPERRRFRTKVHTLRRAEIRNSDFADEE